MSRDAESLRLGRRACPRRSMTSGGKPPFPTLRYLSSSELPCAECRYEQSNNGKPLNVVGKPFRKVDARAKCTGQTKFADDIVLPRMLYCKILRSHRTARA